MTTAVARDGDCDAPSLAQFGRSARPVSPPLRGGLPRRISLGRVSLTAPVLPLLGFVGSVCFFLAVLSVGFL